MALGIFSANARVTLLDRSWFFANLQHITHLGGVQTVLKAVSRRGGLTDAERVFAFSLREKVAEGRMRVPFDGGRMRDESEKFDDRVFLLILHPS
jgi:hypothetical protein